MHHQTTVVALLVVGLLLSIVSNAEDSKRLEANGRSEQTPSWYELRELESQTAKALGRITRLLRERDFDLRVLFEKQKAAANHLDGSLWLEDITLEIQKVAWDYESRIEEANRTFDRLSSELDALKKKLNSIDGHMDQDKL